VQLIEQSAKLPSVSVSLCTGQRKRFDIMKAKCATRNTQGLYYCVDVDWGRGHGTTTPLHLGL
jgi:hypothetical protein